MAGSPKKRARRLAEQAAAAAATPDAAPATPDAAPATPDAPTAEPREKPSTQTGSRVGGRGRARKPKAPARPKRSAGQRGRGGPRFEVATVADFQIAHEATERALTAHEQAQAAQSDEDAALARVVRDEAIVASWALGLLPATIAEKLGLSSEHVARVVGAHRERRAARPIPSSSEYLEDTLDRLEALIERASILASSAENESVRLGSMRTVAELYASKLGLLQAMGRVSERPSDEARQVRARDLLRRMLDELRAEGVDQNAIDRAAARVLNPGAGENVITIDGRATG